MAPPREVPMSDCFDNYEERPMSAPEFGELLRLRVEEEMRDSGVTKALISRRFSASSSAIDIWIKGGRPMPRFFPALARFVRVPVAQMEVWFPEEERRHMYAHRRKL
jgi:hypothetical protein